MGRQDVLRLSPRLAEFGILCGQRDAMHDIDYFLTKPGAGPRVPRLLLVGAPGLDTRNPNLDDLMGFLLIFEQTLFGVGMGVFATNDRSGRSTIVARPSDRVKVASITARALLQRGAQLVLMSFRANETSDSSTSDQPHLLEVASNGRPVARWASRERVIPSYLPLAETYDATLARLGKHTRRNLRHYRRLAEAQLGCMPLTQLDVSREEVIAFSRECMFNVSPKVTAWRYDSLKRVKQPVFMGLKDQKGRWLSMVGGRRYLDRSEILWQLNRDGLAVFSIGTVMRAYFMEQEIAHGSRRLYTEGGTAHSMRFSFTPERRTDLVVIRCSVKADLIRRVARRYVQPDNIMSYFLNSTDLKWHLC